jgi:IS5 family transposase
MLRDRYEAVDIFATVPQLSRAMDPVLAQLDELLDDATIFQQLKADLSRRYPQTLRNGRPSTPVEVLLRILLLKHLHGCSYEDTVEFVADSLVLRSFCRLYWQRVPDDTTLIRWANLLQPATLHALLDHVVALAQQLKVTRGRKLRIDGTVVETNIHPPSDGTLLGDGVRVLSRTLKAAQPLLGETAQRANSLFRDRTRSARRLVKRIFESTRQRGEQAQQLRQTTYKRLVRIVEATLRQVGAVAELLGQQTSAQARSLRERIAQFVPRVQAVIRQTKRRVFTAEQVPASEKLVSIFEPATAIICKGKPHKPVEYGRMVWLNEVEGGIISDYEVLDGNPADSEQVPPRLAGHQRVFKRPPKLLAGDRGCFSEDNEAAAAAAGVEQSCLPKPGAKSAERKAHEAQGWFKRGCNWRAGIEGRIHGLKVGQKLDRCLNHGATGMERWVGWGVISHDLWTIARATAKAA